MTDADKRMNPLNFKSDLADMQIRINPDTLLLEILALEKVCALSGYCCVCRV